MVTRPVAAALACRQCQSSILRAIVSRPATSSFRTLPLPQTRQLPILTKRFYSQDKTIEPIVHKDDVRSAAIEETSEALEAAETADTPWFLEVEPPRHPQSQHAVDLPKVPEDAPEVIEPMIKYIFEDMGLDDISLLDLRDLDPPAALGPNLIMLFATARSERHLHISSGRFQRWLRKQHKIDARADGLIGPGELRTKLRRLRKKAKLMGTNTAIVPGGDNGISTGWVCVHFSSRGDSINESASFDDSGRFSGFGAPQTGITVVVQCMTEARRQELDLETLWQKVLKRNLLENQKARGETFATQQEFDKLLASKIQVPKMPVNESAMQWDALTKASKQQQRRNYSTSSRRLSPALQQQQFPTPESLTEMSGSSSSIEESPFANLDQVSQHVRNLQVRGMHLSQYMLYDLIKSIMMSHSTAENSGPERLALVDQLLLTAEERGMSIWNDEMFATLIESGVSSPAYGPELQRAQKNLESLMSQKGCQFDDAQILRLMTAYAHRQDWSRFWDVFRMPPRFKMARDVKHYELAYRAMALTGSQKMCIDALRWVYPEMMSQDPPVWPIGSLYDSLKACILVADPKAESMMTQPNTFRYVEKLRFIQKRRLQNREFLKVLREVEAMRAELIAQAARDQATGSLAQAVAGTS